MAPGSAHENSGRYCDMQFGTWNPKSLLVIAVTLSWAVSAQQVTAPPSTPVPVAPAAAAPSAAPASLSSSLGVIVFPAKNQTPAQQSSDEGACYTWAKTNTGIDPMAPAQAAPVQPTQDPATAGQGARVKGAARGAAAGAAIGAIAGDTGKGAAIGATTGVMAGGAKKRGAEAQAAQSASQAQAAAAQQTQAAADQQKATFNKGFAACMEGKGYTAK
jgi:Glycine-zipper domain